MAAVAVLLIHIERNQVGNIIPNIILATIKDTALFSYFQIKAYTK